MKLRDWAPEVLKHPETRAYRLLDEAVLKVFSRSEPTWKKWPGKQTTVDTWCLLRNGLAVGMTKDSFPVSRYDDIPAGKIKVTETPTMFSRTDEFFKGFVKGCRIVAKSPGIVCLYLETREQVDVDGLAYLDHPSLSMSGKSYGSVVEFDDFEQPWECWGASVEKSGVKVTLLRTTGGLTDGK